MGLKITTDGKPVKVFRKDKEWNGSTFPTYSIGVSSKDKDGNWVNGYIDCLFKKGVDIPNKTEITINNAFYVCNKSGDKVYNKLMITDFEMAYQDVSNEFMQIPDGTDTELPFL